MQRGRVWVDRPNYPHNCMGENIQRGIVWVDRTKPVVFGFNRCGSILFCLKCEEEVIYHVSFGRVWVSRPKLIVYFKKDLGWLTKNSHWKLHYFWCLYVCFGTIWVCQPKPIVFLAHEIAIIMCFGDILGRSTQSILKTHNKIAILCVIGSIWVNRSKTLVDLGCLPKLKSFIFVRKCSHKAYTMHILCVGSVKRIT